MMASTSLLPWLLLMALVASGYPQDTSSSSSSEESSEEDYGQQMVERFCPGETVDICREKLMSCYHEMQPNTEEEKEKEAAEWKQAMEEFRKEQGGPILTNKDFSGRNTLRKIHKCTLEKLKYLVDGQPNRPYLRKLLLKNISNTTAEFQDALLTAVDTCQVKGDQMLETYYTCVTKACVATM